MVSRRALVRMLLVRAGSRSIAAATSLGGASVDQRLPTRRTSPRRSRSCRRASALSRLRPAARAAIAVENEPGRSRSAGRDGPGAGRSRARPSAAAAARAAQPAPERPPRPARACGRPADGPRNGLGSCRTTRSAPARPGGRAQSDAIHDRSGRRRSAVRRFLSRSGLQYATAFSLTVERHRSIAVKVPCRTAAAEAQWAYPDTSGDDRGRQRASPATDRRDDQFTVVLRPLNRLCQRGLTRC